MKSLKTACVRMTGPDDQMDHKGDKRRPANPLPVKCSHCTFPDLDYIAKPYLLSRGVSSPAETSNALIGNFLVRDRVKRILELVVPGACTFHPTAELKTKAAAPWWLAEPTTKLETLVPKAAAPFCSKCGESKVWEALMGEVWARMKHFDSHGADVFKSVAWKGQRTVEDDYKTTNEHRKKSNLEPLPWSSWDVEPPPHPERWTRRQLDRELYFSVRLEQLFKRAKVKGQLVRLANFSEVKTSPEEEAWIESKLQLLADKGLTEAKASAGKNTGASQKWFAQFLKRNAKKGAKAVDFAAVEKKQKVALPADYKDFIAKIGPKSFADVRDMEGSSTSVLPPGKLDFKSYRRGKVPYLEGDDAKVDGVMFAATDHGDCFVFDVSKTGSDYPVYWYRHEENTMEQFAPNFAECVKRFEQKN